VSSEQPEPRRSEELRAVTARWLETADRLDLSALARFSEAHWTGGWGTDVDEVFPTFELAKQYAVVEFEPGGQDAAEGTWHFGPLDIASWVEGSVGWSIASCNVEMPSGTQQFRATMIFHLERGEWKMVHQHWSFAASEELWGGEPGRALRIMAAIAKAERPDLTEWTSVEGTTTLVFTDIEGSTALNALYGDQAWLDVLRAHNQVVITATEHYGGTVVKSQGDGFMLAFGAAQQALRCALAIQKGIAETFRDPGSPIRVRIGVHTGEPVADADDFFGHAVNYAARVAAAAGPGEILVSALVHDIVSPSGSVHFAAPREVEMKGATGKALVYAVAPESG
jgi:class 3 adenylate cyclase